MTSVGSRPGARGDIAASCAAHGIERDALGFDGVVRAVPESTLDALIGLFGPELPASPPPGIQDVLDAPAGPGCFMPVELEQARVWGLTCQLPSLVSGRNCGMGDFADLRALCLIAAAEGADFVGVNPLHALFWSDPAQASPFFPSNRRFLNPIYIALDWVEGFAGFGGEEVEAIARARSESIVDVVAVMGIKKRVLRRLFENSSPPEDLKSFREAGGDALYSHALFEAISEAMVTQGKGAAPPSWPEPLRDRMSPETAEFAKRNAAVVDFHLWLQWQADCQLRRVREEALAAGMRIGLYLDFAVASAPDGSAAWGAPDLTMSEISIGAPPDPLNGLGQDWGLAPMSPSLLSLCHARPYAADLAAVAKYAGAIRIDHAMSLARLWMIPRGASPKAGAYVRYPLPDMLARVGEVSRAFETLIIGEDLGVVPPGFREILSREAIHRYIVFFFERWDGGFSDPAWWPANGLACVGTHDMPSFAGWWAGSDIDLGHSLGLFEGADIASVLEGRERDRRTLQERLSRGGQDEDVAGLSVRLHADVAASPCRLAALQLEDAICFETQVNIPGTVTEHPNWLQKLPVGLEGLAENDCFRRHAEAMRNARPR